MGDITSPCETPPGSPLPRDFVWRFNGGRLSTTSPPALSELPRAMVIEERLVHVGPVDGDDCHGCRKLHGAEEGRQSTGKSPPSPFPWTPNASSVPDGFSLSRVHCGGAFWRS